MADNCRKSNYKNIYNFKINKTGILTQYVQCDNFEGHKRNIKHQLSKAVRASKNLVLSFV